MDTDLKCKTEDWSCELKPKTEPDKQQHAPENFLQMRNQKNGSEMVKMRP